MAEEYINWQDYFNTGEPQIDEQHQQIFKYINQLHAALKLEKDEKEINEVLLGLMEYSIYHFKLEEQMMEQVNYPQYESHKEEHQIFIDRLTKLEIDLKNHNKSITLRLLKFLKVWFSGHILNIDHKFVQFKKTGQSE
jgi:hemerythrin